MRHYPANSPRAAARVVALTLLADGALTRCELGLLARFGIYERLGLDGVEMQAVVEELARDLYEFGVPAWDHSGGLHHLVVRSVLADVTDPGLRQDVLDMCRTLAESDAHITDGEEAVLQLAGSLWRLSPSPQMA